MIEIEENVPIPPKQGKYSSLVHKMKEGDSVVCSSFTESETVRQAIYTCEGYKPIVRIQLDDKDTYRVWKVKK